MIKCMNYQINNILSIVIIIIILKLNDCLASYLLSWLGNYVTLRKRRDLDSRPVITGVVSSFDTYV